MLHVAVGVVARSDSICPLPLLLVVTITDVAII